MTGRERSDLVFEGALTPDDRRRWPYVELPFEVPAGVGRIELHYRYDSGSILDLGLLDPEIEPFPSPAGLRGWSGSARDRCFVAAADATPGFLPGAIAAGTWRVLLGLAAIAPTGCRYRVEISLLSGDEEAPAGPFAPPGRARAASGWYRGDLQSHTHYSDAKGSLQDLIRAARARRLDFLAVTDHNTSAHHRELAAASSPDLLLLPGQEVTTYRGHANVWGVAGTVDFRIWNAAQWDALAAQVHARGGLLSLNHPKRQPGCIGCDWEWPVPVAADAFEAWQGPWPFGNDESLARYDALLAQGRRLTLVGGSDRHQPGWPDPDPPALQVGSPTTWLRLDELSPRAVLSALRAGRACVSDGPDGPRLDIRLDGVPMGSAYDPTNAGEVEVHAVMEGAEGLTLRWVGQQGVVREVAATGAEDRWRWRPEGGFLRAELVARSHPPELISLLRGGAGGRVLPGWLDVQRALSLPPVRALSNPVYLRGPY